MRTTQLPDLTAFSRCQEEIGPAGEGLFVSLQSGGSIQIVSTKSERDRFMRYCNRERIRCGLVRVDETGNVVELPVIEVE